jgi:hypothetical protein
MFSFLSTDSIVYQTPIVDRKAQIQRAFVVKTDQIMLCIVYDRPIYVNLHYAFASNHF